MFAKCLTLLLCLGLIGCTSLESLKLSQKYNTIYNYAFYDNNVVTVNKDENYQDIKQRLSKYVGSFGYSRVVFVDPKRGFIVLAKDWGNHPSQIILKYTARAQANRITIELVKASDDLSTDNEVSEDIQGIARLIRND